MDASLPRFAHALLRTAAGALFLQHGLQKTFGLLGGVNGLGAAASLGSFVGAVGLLELIGGGLLMIGLFTRPAAAALCLEMVVALALTNRPVSGWPPQALSELALVYAVLFAFLAASGAGTFSIDTLLHSTLRLERRRPQRDRRQPQPEPFVPHLVAAPLREATTPTV
mgnify:CR=1 FL=1